MVLGNTTPLVLFRFALDNMDISCYNTYNSKVYERIKMNPSLGMHDLKTCSKCKKPKFRTVHFGKNKNTKSGFYNICKECINEYSRCKIYGLSFGTRNNLLIKQKNKLCDLWRSRNIYSSI